MLKKKKTFVGGLHTAAADVDRLFSRHFFFLLLTFCSPFSCVSEQRRHGYVTSWIGGEAVTLQIINQLLTNTSFGFFVWCKGGSCFNAATRHPGFVFKPWW